jgi:hypothetical protein
LAVIFAAGAVRHMSVRAGLGRVKPRTITDSVRTGSTSMFSLPFSFLEDLVFRYR